MKNLINELVQIDNIDLSLWSPPGEMNANIHFLPDSNESKWLNHLMEQGGIIHLLRNKPLRGLIYSIKLLNVLHKTYRQNQVNTDIFHINWLQNSLPLYGTKNPAVISILGSDYGLLKLPGMVPLLRVIFKQRRTILVPNANWMADKLNHYFSDVATIHPVPFGVRQEWFNIKRILSDEQPKKWLVVSRLTKNKIGPLFDWGEDLFTGQHELHLFGPMQEEMKIPDWVHYHGSTFPIDLEKNWFPNAHGLVTLSEHDEGRPQVMLEAMASGLPIIASNLEAHNDLIQHNKTGIIVNNKSEVSIALQQLSNIQYNKDIGKNAQHWLHEEIGTWSDCAQKYHKLYQSLLN
jgi:glycosyltransferase involved in cell wall biosynthesis